MFFLGGVGRGGGGDDSKFKMKKKQKKTFSLREEGGALRGKGWMGYFFFTKNPNLK